MQFISTPVRPAGEPTRLTAAYAAQEGFWAEGTAVAISEAEAAMMRAAVRDVVAAYRGALDHVVAHRDQYAPYFLFTEERRENPLIFEFVCESWQRKRQRGYVLDRWDMAWDGDTPPKLLERNFGYVGLIAGTSTVQEDYAQWLATQSGFEDVRTFGDLRTGFLGAFQHAAREHEITPGARIALLVNERESDPGMVAAADILASWIQAAGYQVTQFPCMELFADGEGPVAMVSLPDDLMAAWQARLPGAKMLGEHLNTVRLDYPHLYPFYSASDDFVRNLAVCGSVDWQRDDQPARLGGVSSTTDVFGAAWELLAGHKAMLPVLYELFPGHPNLLPCSYFRADFVGQPHIVKRARGVQGIGARVVNAEGRVVAARHVNPEQPVIDYGHIFQALAPACQTPAGDYQVFHVFTANNEPAALGARCAPGPFVGGSDTDTRFRPVFVRGRLGCDAARL